MVGPLSLSREQCHGVCSWTGLRSLERTRTVTGRQEAFLNSHSDGQDVK